MKTISVFSLLVLTLTASACSIDVDRFSKDGIKVEPLPPIQSNELKCDTDTLTKLELTKCEMNARLMELKY